MKKAGAQNYEGKKSSPPVRGAVVLREQDKIPLLFFPLTSPAAWPKGGIVVVGSTQKNGIQKAPNFWTNK